MSTYVLGFQDIDGTQAAVVGGKAAHLGDLSRIDAVCVPAGFCVTIEAFTRIMEAEPSIDDTLDREERSQERHLSRRVNTSRTTARFLVARPDQEVAAAWTQRQ